MSDVRFQPPALGPASRRFQTSRSGENGEEPDVCPAAVGRVWINDRQYFEGVAETEWHFRVGGYCPAQCWLKDRWVREKGKPRRKLSFEDITAYARIIYALGETHALMSQIDQAIEAHGGWPLK